MTLIQVYFIIGLCTMLFFMRILGTGEEEDEFFTVLAVYLFITVLWPVWIVIVAYTWEGTE